MIFLILLIICGYIFVGGLIAGIITDPWLETGEAIGIALFWPVIVVMLIVIGILWAPLKLGEIIKEKFHL